MDPVPPPPTIGGGIGAGMGGPMGGPMGGAWPGMFGPMGGFAATPMGSARALETGTVLGPFLSVDASIPAVSGCSGICCGWLLSACCDGLLGLSAGTSCRGWLLWHRAAVAAAVFVE